jgi:uncharacterized MnhB-related membrane protein
MNLDLQDIFFLLGPQSGDLVFNIFLYLIFFLALIMLFIMPDKNLLPTLLCSTVLLCAIIAKLSLSAPASQAILSRREFGMLIINIVMMLFPLLVAGMVRTRARRNPVVPLGIFTFIIGALYTATYFILIQNVA